jgi:hypothetical protein
MAGKIFVHIGLPKTATTTLQTDFFPVIAIGDITYLGVYQPRETRHVQLYTDIYDAIKNGQMVTAVRNEIIRRLQAGETLIISEEMIVVAQDAATFQKKLGNLSALLNGLDYQIILTVREPVSALFSFYVERYDEFYKRNMTFMDAATKEESMFIFHYRKLADALLANFERQRVHIFKFENIINRHLQQLCDLIAPGKHQESEFQFTNHNKKAGSEGVVLANKQSTAAAFLRRHSIFLKERSPAIYNIARYVVKPLGFILERIRLAEMKVKRPSEAEMSCLKVYLHEETAALDTMFGIKY